MADTTPPVVKGGGNTGFIIAAIIMALVTGGLLLWKLTGSEEPEKADATPPPPKATQTTFEQPPPPPPPLEEVEDAGSDVPEEKTVRRPAGGCNAPCGGKETPALLSALRSKASQARGCYERGLRQNSMLQGQLMLAAKIGAQGQVCSASLVRNELDPGVGSCVLQMFRSSDFPAPQGGCVDTQVPMNFVPKQ